MITDLVFIYILLIHFLADFALQTHEQASNKSSSLKWLSYHVGTYSIIWTLGATILFSDLSLGLVFGAITFIAHFITDYVTSRIGKKFWEKGDHHNGFVVVGFDQILHYLQLYYTIKLFIESGIGVNF